MTKTKKEAKNKQGKQLIEVPHRGFWGHFLFGIGMFLTRTLGRYRVVGTEDIPEPPYVISSNHVTLVDGMWICAGLPQKHQKVFTAIAGSDLMTDYGLFGQIMMLVGRAIPVNRFGNPVRGLIMAKKAVDQGYIMLVHPEGTRSSDGKLAKLQDGASYISIKSNVPMVPTYVHGGYEVFSRHMSVPKPFDWKKFKRKSITIEFGKPLLPTDYNNVSEMTEALRQWLLTRQEKPLT